MPTPLVVLTSRGRHLVLQIAEGSSSVMIMARGTAAREKSFSWKVHGKRQPSGSAVIRSRLPREGNTAYAVAAPTPHVRPAGPCGVGGQPRLGLWGGCGSSGPPAASACS
eukprot:1612494-Prymnesium_polylepis.1